MERNIITPETAALVIEAANQVKQAAIFQGNTNSPFDVQLMTLDLSTAKLAGAPLKIGFPFKSIYIADGTDTTIQIDVQINTQDSFQSSFPMSLNDSWIRDEPTAQAFISWAAQAGKSITIAFFVNSEFQSGKQISVTGGGVSLIDGSSIALGTAVTLIAATAAAIAPALSTRKIANIQNKTGADLYIGDSTVTNSGATEGIKIPNDGLIEWRNTGALYGYSVAGGKVSRTEET